MSSDLQIRDDLCIPAAELRWRFSCSSGPGGQNVNKVASRATLLWDLAHSRVIQDWQRERIQARLPRSYLTAEGEVQVSAQDTRSQLDNRQACLDRLTTLLQRALQRPQARAASKPTRASIARRFDNKKKRGDVKKQRSWKPEA
jgi:ribosome-associated protein